MDSGAEKELIIIGGAARSGTTLLHSLVGAHPAIHGALSEWFGWGYQQPKLARAAGIAAPDTPERMRRLLTIGLTETPMRESGADLDLALSLVGAYPNDWDHLMLIVVEAMQGASGASRVVVKTPYIEHDVPFLTEFFLENGWRTRWLYSVRHPYDVYLSDRRRAPEWRRQLLHSDVLRWCGSWLDSTAAALENRCALPEEDFRVQRFEDVLEDPRAVCRDLCLWLGVDAAEETMIEAQGRKWNTSFGETQVAPKSGAVRDLRSRPRTGLSSAEETALRIACGLRARAFGYKLGAPGELRRPRGFQQTIAMSQLTAAEYLRFALRDGLRRAGASVKTAYSLATGRRTTSTSY